MEQKGNRWRATKAVIKLFSNRKERGPGIHLRAQLEEKHVSSQD